MLSKRLETIISLIDKNKSVIDIGTDHAILTITISQINITSKIIATDIKENICKKAQNSINKANINNIKIIQSDGFKNIQEKYDIAILSGMGTHTILNIIKNSKCPETLIISSQNDYEMLRRELNKLNYKIIKEIVIYEKKYYPIIKYKKGKEKLTENDIIFGKSNNKEYYKYLQNKYLNLYNKSKTEEFKNNYNKLTEIIEKMSN